MEQPLFGVFSLVLGVTVLVSVPSAQAPPPVAHISELRELISDPSSPAVLDGIRTVPVEQLQLDTTGMELSMPVIWQTDPATGAQFRRGELLVKFREEADAGVRAQSMIASGAEPIVSPLPENWARVALRPDTSASDARTVFQADAAVQEVALNYRATAFQAAPSDEFYRLQWNFEALNLPKAWEINPGAVADVVVAVIDTGLNFRTATLVFSSPFGRIPVRFAAVPDLVTDERIVHAYDFVYDDELPVDLGGHGTHVAGTIGQETNNSLGVAGVAYNVKLMPLKVISGAGSVISWDDVFFPGNRGGSSDVISRAIRYAADNGAKIINLSLGALAPMPIIRDAIQYAVDRGVFVAIAAGNDAASGNPTTYPAAYGGAIDGAMTVGAVSRGLKRARYSGFKDYVEICAPGGETPDYESGITQVGYNDQWTLRDLSPLAKILALRLGFRPRFDQFELVPLTGTSMATPHVSGVAALLYAQGIRDPRAIEDAIKRFASPIDARADECGAGLVDPRRALRGLGLAR